MAFALLAIAGLPAVPAVAAPAPVTSQDFTVTATTDGISLEARYYRPAAAGTYPVVFLAHGGGGTVNSEAPRAQAYAELGFVGVVWSARGHGNSGGLFDFFGPKTVQDSRDVMDWVVAHAAQTGADPARMGITGYSQGGGTTNLVEAFDSRVKASAPGHTFSGLAESLKPNGCVKFSIDAVILSAAYLAMGARTDPVLISRWSNYLETGAEVPNPSDGKLPSEEFELRSPRNYVARMPAPALWVQAFDDSLFPVDQAVAMFHALPNPHNHLYLSWGGHFAPNPPAYELTYRETQMQRWMSRWLRGDGNGIDGELPVTYWYLAADRTNVVRVDSPTWPPPGVVMEPVSLTPGQALSGAGLQGFPNDPAVQFGANASGMGSTLKSLPDHTPVDTIITTTPALAADELYAGAAHADLQWSSTGSPSQVSVKVWDMAPDGSATLLARACTAVPGAAGTAQHVSLDLWHDAVLVPAGHHFEVWVQPSDAPLWQPPPVGLATLGAGSTVTLPILHAVPGAPPAKPVVVASGGSGTPGTSAAGPWSNEGRGAGGLLAGAIGVLIVARIRRRRILCHQS